MNDKDTLLTLLLLGGLALVGYWLIQKTNSQAPAPQAQPLPEPQPNTGSDVVNPQPSPFGYSVGDPCKRFPSLCKFW